MTKPRLDVGASVRARLLRLAKERGEDFHLVLTQYVNERVLYRLASSRHGARFVLKGAALFTLWTGKAHRATRDVDLLGFGEVSEDRVRATFGEVFSLDVGDDGVRFDLGSIEVGPIRQEQAYGGVRVVVLARVTAARVRVQIDIGVGDAITPDAVTVDFPTLLPEFAAPRLRAYPRETVVAEKLDAVVQLGLANSRLKDFYDLLVLSRMFDFDGAPLVEAIRATFERRKTRLPVGLPVGLTEAFAGDPTRQSQWAAFARKSGAGSLGSLTAAVSTIVAFVERPLAAVAGEAPFGEHWERGGPWSDR